MFFLLYFFSLAQSMAIFHQTRLTLWHVLYFHQCLVATFVSLTRPLKGILLCPSPIPANTMVTEMRLDLTLRNLSVMTGRTRGTRNDVGSVVVYSRCCSVAVVASARWHQVVTVHQCTRVSGGYSAPENLSIRCCSTTVSANKAKHRLHQVLQCTRELHQVATERLVPNTCLTARHDSPKPDPPTDNK